MLLVFKGTGRPLITGVVITSSDELPGACLASFPGRVGGEKTSSLLPHGLGMSYLVHVKLGYY